MYKDRQTGETVYSYQDFEDAKKLVKEISAVTKLMSSQDSSTADKIAGLKSKILKNIQELGDLDNIDSLIKTVSPKATTSQEIEGLDLSRLLR